MELSIEKAKSLLDKCVAEAQGFIQDPSKVDDLLEQLEGKLQEVPKIGETLSDLPVMIAMVKGYITREYSAVSPKVIAILVGAFVYMVRKKDVIPDDIPVIGIADDLGVLGLALNLCKPELEAFKAFREEKKQQEAGAPAENEEPAEEMHYMECEEPSAEAASATSDEPTEDDFLEYEKQAEEETSAANEESAEEDL